MSLYRKRPVVVAATRFDGPNGADVAGWAAGLGGPAAIAVEKAAGADHLVLTVLTPEGMALARPGDWIVCGGEGEFHPCEPVAFDATYELLPGESAP